MPEVKRKNAWLYDPGEFAKLLWQSLQEQAQRTAQWYGTRPLGAVGGEVPSSFPSWLTPRTQAFMPGAPTARTQEILQTGRGLLGAPTPAKREPRIVIEQEGGYDVLVQYDENGNRTIVDVIGQRKETGLTAYEKAMLDIRAQEINREDWRTAQGLMGEQTAYARQRMGQLAVGRGRFDEVAANSRAFEEWRRRLGAALPEGQRQWIEKWTVAKMPNPFEQQLEEIRGNAIYEAEFAKEDAAYWEKINKDKAKELATALSEMPSNYRDERAERTPESAIAWNNVMNLMESQQQAKQNATVNKQRYDKIISSPEYAETKYWATPRPNPNEPGSFTVGKEDPEAKQKPTTPPTPSWLPEFVPELKGQTNISKFAVAPPSLQKWATTPWSQREGLMDYATWAGQEPTEILEEMSLRQTATPRIASRWAPAFQRA